MAIPAEKLLEEVLAQPAEVRAMLHDKLAESLEPALEDDVRAAWAKEALRRLEDVRTGKVKAIPAEEADARIRKRLGI